MASKKTKEFNEQISDILLSHGITIPEESKEGLFASFDQFYKDYKEPKVTTEYWEELVEQYFEFYRLLNNGIDPLFGPAQGSGLKKISSHLKRRFLKTRKSKQEFWTLEIALHRHMEMYKLSCLLPRVKKLFSAAYLYNNFDNIVSELNQLFKQEEATKRKLLAE